MYVDRVDLHIRVESVLVEQNRARSEVGDDETVREALVLKVLNGLLESIDVPFPSNVVLDGSRSTSPRPWLQLSMLRRVCSR